MMMVQKGSGIAAGLLAHRFARAVTPQHQSSHDHRDRPRQIQGLGQGIDAGGQRQGDSDLDAIVVDRAHRPNRRQAQDEAERAAAPGGDQHLDAKTQRRDCAVAEGQCRCGAEQHDADAVVEQRLALDQSADVGRQ